MNKQNNQKPITPKGVSGINSTITAWAVEIEGKIDPDFVFNNRATARHVRNTEASVGLYKKISTRKVVIQVVDGR